MYLYLFNKLSFFATTHGAAHIAIHTFRANSRNASTSRSARKWLLFARGVYRCLQDEQKRFYGLTHHHIFPPLRERLQKCMHKIEREEFAISVGERECLIAAQQHLYRKPKAAQVTNSLYLQPQKTHARHVQGSQFSLAPRKLRQWPVDSAESINL